jgi:hypothetical protein
LYSFLPTWNVKSFWKSSNGMWAIPNADKRIVIESNENFRVTVLSSLIQFVLAFWGSVRNVVRCYHAVSSLSGRLSYGWGIGDERLNRKESFLAEYQAAPEHRELHRIEISFSLWLIAVISRFWIANMKAQIQGSRRFKNLFNFERCICTLLTVSNSFFESGNAFVFS